MLAGSGSLGGISPDLRLAYAYEIGIAGYLSPPFSCHTVNSMRY